MKRIVMLMGSLAILLACCQTAAAGEKKQSKKTPPLPPPVAPQWQTAPVPMTPTAVVDKSANPEDTQVQELIKILNETKSPTVLVATAVALVPLGDKAKTAVPTILRNAERLKVLEDINNPNSRKCEMANVLMDAIFAVQAGWTPDRNGANPFTPRPERFAGPVPAGPPPTTFVQPAPYYVPTAPCPGPVCPQPSALPPPPRME